MTSMEGNAAIRVMLHHQSQGTKVAIVAYIEFKNEIGLHGDGGLQGTLSLRKHVSQTDYDEIQNGFSCPTLPEASQPIFDVLYREILAFRVKNRESGESRISLS
ncbi:hypothetical protein V8E52_005878 [Russula decolorans]